MNFAPNLAFSELPGLWITPLLEAEYSGASNLLLIDDELFIYARNLKLYYLLGANLAPSRNWLFKLKGFGRNVFVSEANTEDLGTGMYDFNDAGAWLEAAVKYRAGSGMRTRLGFKGYARRYPHYDPLLDQAAPTLAPPGAEGEEFQSPDIDVGEIWLRQEAAWPGIGVLTNFELRIRDVRYVEQKVLDGVGAVTDEARRDQYLQAGVEIPILLNRSHQFELGYQHTLRATNQRVYDQEFDLYLDYYQYRQHRARARYSVETGLRLGGFPLRGAVGFSYQNRVYVNRPALRQIDDGTEAYDPDRLHAETTLDFSITLRQALFTEWFHVFLSYHGITRSSTTTAGDPVSYNYGYQTVSLGTAVSF